MYIRDKEKNLISLINKELLEISKEKVNNSTEKWAKDINSSKKSKCSGSYHIKGDPISLKIRARKITIANQNK